ARALGRRSVFLVGSFGKNGLPERLPERMIACAYAPHGQLFPRAAAIVHQCGIGTTAQALRSSRPALCVPFAHDQPDNAARCARLGTARVLLRARYNARSAARELGRLLDDPAYARKAAEVGRAIAAENGGGAACD